MLLAVQKRVLGLLPLSIAGAEIGFERDAARIRERDGTYNVHTRQRNALARRLIIEQPQLQMWRKALQDGKQLFSSNIATLITIRISS